MTQNGSRPTIDGNRLSPGKAFGLYFVFVFLGGSLLAPWVYWLVHSFSALAGLPNSILQSPFHRYVNRMCLFLAVVGLVPLWRRLEGRSSAALRGCFHWGRAGDFWKGCFLGFLSLAGLAVIVVATGGRDVNTRMGAGALVDHCLSAGISALSVSFLEEILFRGVLFRGLCRQYSFATSAGVSSAVYAWVHFFRRPEPPAGVEWWTGLQTLRAMGEGFFDLNALVPAYINLFLAGWILAMMFRVTGALWFSIGLHAGWIFWLKSYGKMTVAAPGGEGWFLGASRILDGWLATAVLAGVGAACCVGWRRGAAKSLPTGVDP